MNCKCVRVAEGSETCAEREGFDGNDHERVEKKERKRERRELAMRKQDQG